MGDEDIGGGRCDDRLPLRVAAGILGQTDKRGHDSDTYDRASHDAFTALPESSADHGMRSSECIRNLSGSKKIFEQENISTLRWKPEGVFGIIGIACDSFTEMSLRIDRGDYT